MRTARRLRGQAAEGVNSSDSFDELLSRKVKEILKEELRSFTGSRTRLIDLTTVGPPKRFMYREARTGKIGGAVKLNGHWYAPESSVEEWTARHERKPAEPAPDSVHGVDAIRSRLGLIRIG